MYVYMCVSIYIYTVYISMFRLFWNWGCIQYTIKIWMVTTSMISENYFEMWTHQTKAHISTLHQPISDELGFREVGDISGCC